MLKSKSLRLFAGSAIGHKYLVFDIVRFLLHGRANDICKESKRQTINAEDVLTALEEMEFPEFIGPLRASLDG